MTKNTSSTSTASSIAKAAVAAALAGALSMGAAAPAIALADEGAPSQQTTVEQGDGQADEQAWDGSADESGFAADAGSYAADAGVAGAENGAANGAENGAVDGSHGPYDPDWWYRRVAPWQAFSSAEYYFGIGDYDSWDYAIGRYRGIPAYRIVIECGDHWRPWQPWGMATRYVAFVNYFTGNVIAGYADYE